MGYAFDSGTTASFLEDTEKEIVSIDGGAAGRGENERARFRILGSASPEPPGISNSLFLSVHSLLLIGDLGAAADRLMFALEKYPNEPLFISFQGLLHARQNQADAAMECVRKALDFPFSLAHQHHTYHQLACIYAVLGDIEKAMAWLEKSVDTGFPCWPFFQVDPSLENLRGESRFQRLIEDLKRKYTALKISRT